MFIVKFACKIWICFPEHVLGMHMPAKGVNLLECFAYTGDLQGVSNFFKRLVELYQSLNEIKEMSRRNQLEFAKLIIPYLKNTLHITCALGHWDVFDFIIKICSRAGTDAFSLLTKQAQMNEPQIQKFKKNYLQITVVE